MISLDHHLRLVDTIYDAALDASRWDGVIAGIVHALGGRGGALLVYEAGTRRILNVSNIGVDDPHVRIYNEYYWKLDPIAPALEAAADGAVLPHHEIIPRGQARQTEFYNDFAFPFDIGDGLAARLLVEPGRIAWLNICGHLKASSFAAPTQVELLRSLLPHLQRSLRIQMLLGNLVIERERAHVALDRLENGIALIARSGAILFANASALAQCGDADGLTISRGGMLRAARSDENVLLHGLIATATGAVDGVPQAGGMMIHRPSGARPFSVHVLPLAPGDAQPPFKEAGAMIVIVDTSRDCVVLTDLLVRLYRLTPAEARVAASTLRCEGLQHVAEELQVTLSTVRIHLQRIFDKTDTHRQAELVRLLLRLQAGLMAHGPGTLPDRGAISVGDQAAGRNIR